MQHALPVAGRLAKVPHGGASLVAVRRMLGKLGAQTHVCSSSEAAMHGWGSSGAVAHVRGNRHGTRTRLHVRRHTPAPSARAVRRRHTAAGMARAVRRPTTTERRASRCVRGTAAVAAVDAVQGGVRSLVFHAQAACPRPCHGPCVSRRPAWLRRQQQLRRRHWVAPQRWRERPRRRAPAWRRVGIVPSRPTWANRTSHRACRSRLRTAPRSCQTRLHSRRALQQAGPPPGAT